MSYIWIYSWPPLAYCTRVYCRLFWTATSRSQWWSLQTLPATSTFTRTGQVLLGTRASTLSKKKRPPFLRMRWYSLSSIMENNRLPPQNYDLCEFLAFGDIYPNALDHFCSLVEEVATITYGSYQIRNQKLLQRWLCPYSATRTTWWSSPNASHTTSRSRCGWRYMLLSYDDHPLSKVHELATAVYQIRGHIKGRTLLPFPQVAQ